MIASFRSIKLADCSRFVPSCTVGRTTYNGLVCSKTSCMQICVCLCSLFTDVKCKHRLRASLPLYCLTRVLPDHISSIWTLNWLSVTYRLEALHGSYVQKPLLYKVCVGIRNVFRRTLHSRYTGGFTKSL